MSPCCVTLIGCSTVKGVILFYFWWRGCNWEIDLTNESFDSSTCRVKFGQVMFRIK